MRRAIPLLPLYASMALYGKGKAIPVKAWTGPQGSRRFKLPEFLDNKHMKMTRLSAIRTGCLYPWRYSWYSFLLENVSIPGQ
jgi:hypothetical protein